MMQLAPNDNTPAKGPACLENCQMCLSNATPSASPQSLPTSTTTHSQIANKVNQTNRTTTVIKKSDEKFGDSNENENHSSSSKYRLFKKSTIGTTGDNKFASSRLKNYNSATSNENDDDNMHTAKTINGKFFMVNGANISCACSRSPNGISKYAHLCDGYIDLCIVRHTTFFNNIKFLMAMSSQNCIIVSSLLLTLLTKCKQRIHLEFFSLLNFSRICHTLKFIEPENSHSDRMVFSRLFRHIIFTVRECQSAHQIMADIRASGIVMEKFFTIRKFQYGN